MVESLLICVALLWIFKQVRLEARADPPIFIDGMTPREYRRFTRQQRRQQRQLERLAYPIPRAGAWAIFIAIIVGFSALATYAGH